MALRNRTSVAGSTIGDPDVTSRRIKSSGKYSNIAATLDTGRTVTKARFTTTKQRAARRAEVFQRIRVGDLYKMVVEAEETGESLYEAAAPGGLRVVTVDAAAASGTTDEKPFLLLDVRSPEDFAECRLVDAAHFPLHLLHQDKVTPELFRFRNKPGAIIVLYDDDGETLAPKAATAFLQKGYENVRVLHGGVKAVVAKHPLMLDGEPPSRLLPPPPKDTARAPAGLGLGRGRPVRASGGTSVISASYSPNKGGRGSRGGSRA